MPTKTKKEKILAEQHRKFRIAPSAATLPSLSYVPTSATDTLEFELVKRDITKTILLGLTAIGIELGIYWYNLVRS